jgi:HAE1 family hydrophobic/amphiphilic exporter-1
MPPDISISIVNDNSVWIQDSIHEILFNIQFGTLLAVLVIFLFLAIVVGVLAAILPARRAARIDILEAIHYE